VRTSESHENIVALSDIREEKLRALSPYGPVKAGLTTLPSQETHTANQLAQLSELVSSLESVVETLIYKSFTAYDMLASATENLRAAHLAFIEGTGGTDE
jgi:hypothetical protein